MTHHDDEQEVWQAWPCCPQCGQRRRAVCPICQDTRDDFPLADYIPEPAPLQCTRPRCEAEAKCAEEQAESTLLRCAACDEAFAPQFVRQCEACGHDFGDGLNRGPEESEGTSGRAILVLMGLVILSVATLAYFWYLLQHGPE